MPPVALKPFRRFNDVRLNDTLEYKPVGLEIHHIPDRLDNGRLACYGGIEKLRESIFGIGRVGEYLRLDQFIDKPTFKLC